jgi:hypothetical protein
MSGKKRVQALPAFQTLEISTGGAGPPGTLDPVDPWAEFF